MIAKLQTFLARLTLGVSALLIAWVTLFILYGAFMRYFFGASPIWFAELARYSIIGAAMIGMGAVWIEGAHMRVSVIESIVPPSFKHLIVFYQWALTLFLTGSMTWFSYEYIDRVSFFSTPGLQISRSVPVTLLPIGFGLLFLMVVLHGPRAMRAQAVEAD